MGTCNFKVFGIGKDVNDAFNKAVSNALYEHGHDSYNGTISTTSFCADITKDMPRYGTKAFSKALDKKFDSGGIEKWDCYAVEVKGAELKTYRERHGLQRKRIRLFLFFGLAAC